MTKNMDELIAEMPDFLRNRFAAIEERRAGPVTPTIEGNGGALSGIHADEDEPRPEPLPAAPWTGRIQPSIHCDKGAQLSVWNVNGRVDVVLRDGNGYEHFGRMAPLLQAEGGFAAVCDDEERAFRDMIYQDVVGVDRAARTNSAGEFISDADDPNYSRRATCLWTNRDRTGAAHPRAFLVMTWGGEGRGAYPKDALLFDGSNHRIFKLQRETASGNRPNWTGRAQ